MSVTETPIDDNVVVYETPIDATAVTKEFFPRGVQHIESKRVNALNICSIFLFLVYKMKFASAIMCSVVAATTSDEHSDHDHSLLKPSGNFYGLISHSSASGKNWNDMEMLVNFGGESFDLTWWYGVKNALVNVPKQMFNCAGVPFAFDESTLEVSIDVANNACFSAIRAKFDAGMIPDVIRMPVDHETGDLNFPIAGGVISMDMYAIDGPITIPSGIDGMAPTNPPARRGASTATATKVQADAVAETTTKTAANMFGLITILTIFAIII